MAEYRLHQIGRFLRREIGRRREYFRKAYTAMTDCPDGAIHPPMGFGRGFAGAHKPNGGWINRRLIRHGGLGLNNRLSLAAIIQTL
ncbi:MAG: hypothetical protein CMK72_20805 [Pseudomonadaceae bacterium]|nr:hypothetical protein [Pseudomonadaceae bacterium]